MKRNVKTYLDLMGLSTDFLSVACVDDILQQAVKDGIKELEMNKEEYDQFCRYMVTFGAWNWDKETFMGIKFVIKKND